LLHLWNEVNSRKKANLIISNWIYTVEKNGRTQIVGDFDVLKKKTCTTLEEFFCNNLYIPGGIMQYCIHRDKLNELKNYHNEISPHVGLFFKCFPGRVVCASSPGLCRVSKIESSGWRSSPYGAYKEIINCFEFYIRLIKKACKENQITRKTGKRVIKEYTRFSWLILKECWDDQWGKWAPTKTEKVCFCFLLVKGLLRGSLFQGLANIRYLQKMIKKELETSKRNYPS